LHLLAAQVDLTNWQFPGSDEAVLKEIMIYSLTSLLALVALHGASSARPQYDHEAMSAWTNTSESAALLEEPVTSKDSILRHSFAAVSAVTGLPVWGVRAAVWPVFKNPGVAASLAALDMVASHANMTHTVVSFIQVSRTGPIPGPARLLDPGFLAALLLGFVVSCIIVLAVPLLHKGRVTDRRPEFPDPIQDEVSMAEDPHDFHTNAIRCCGPSTCLYALCFPSIRHADTLSSAGLRGFWSVYITFLLIDGFCGSIFAGFEMSDAHPSTFVIDGDAALIQGVLLALFFVTGRRALRTKLEAPEPGSWLKDILLWVCCPCFAIAQEAAEVDMAQGVTVSCPCRLHDVKTGELVGAPVAEAAEATED